MPVELFTITSVGTLSFCKRLKYRLHISVWRKDLTMNAYAELNFPHSQKLKQYDV